MLARAMERDHLRAKWVAGDDAFGMSPSFREGLAALGMWYVLDVPGGTTVWPLEPAWTSPDYQGFRRPRKPKLRDGQRRIMVERSEELPGHSSPAAASSRPMVATAIPTAIADAHRRVRPLKTTE